MNAALNSSAADLKMAPICQELFSFCDIILESLFFSMNHEKRTIQEQKEPSNVALNAAVVFGSGSGEAVYLWPTGSAGRLHNYELRIRIITYFIKDTTKILVKNWDNIFFRLPQNILVGYGPSRICILRIRNTALHTTVFSWYVRKNVKTTFYNISKKMFTLLRFFQDENACKGARPNLVFGYERLSCINAIPPPPSSNPCKIRVRFTREGENSRQKGKA